ncbi:hypothetical protein ACFBZI_12025 [Moraxella sp. ZJ142]|uniref:hypothetical protein n=1 Tax=Moraxella marmotae TaxID=3344520 RepID=UPI0035D4F56F
MLNQSKIDKHIDNLAFHLELEDSQTNFDTKNPFAVEQFLQQLKEEYAFEVQNIKTIRNAYNKVQKLVQEHRSQPDLLGTDEIKAVFIKLKARKLHPIGGFDKMGRFFLKDWELVNARPPSKKYPYSQMTASRTSAFVKEIAKKYKPRTQEDLEKHFLVNDAVLTAKYKD